MCLGSSLRWLFFFLFLFFLGKASHNTAGQITYKHISGNTYEILLTTYTDPSNGVDRCFATLEIWDSQGKVLIDSIVDIPRENGAVGSCPSPANMGEPIRPPIKRNFYRAIYTFPGPGTYLIRYADFARIYNITNMFNSGQLSFYVETILSNVPQIGENNSPILLNDPIDNACTNKLWTHNPGAYDPDGDSLVFELIPCRSYTYGDTTPPVVVPGYQYPDAFGGTFTIDPVTGLITWDTPQQPGIYSIAFRVIEYRNGRKIGEVVRDMAVFVDACINNPPYIDAITEACIIPGDTLRFQVFTSDPDAGDSLYFYLNNGNVGYNGPFAVANQPATINPPLSAFPIQGFPPYQATVEWIPLCEHIRNTHYQIDFYAHDNLGHSPPLHADHIVKIYVKPPPVDSLVLTPVPGGVMLSWSPNPCSEVVSYQIYRSVDSVSTEDSCCTASPAGYELVATVPGYQTTYLDSPLVYRPRYCYVVVSVFPRGMFSCPSPIACIDLPRIVPLFTRDSVITTDVANGSIQVRWLKPDTTPLNKQFYPPPYRYDLYRKEGTSGSWTQIATNLAFDDTAWVDNGLNTETYPYYYHLEMKDNTGRSFVTSGEVSSVFLQAIGAQRSVFLSWSYQTPWVNDSFVIWRRNPGSSSFQPIDTVYSQTSYWDKGLLDRKEYCYFVRSYGSYQDTAVGSLINDSQIACAFTIDTIPPCLMKDSIQMASDCEAFWVQFTLSGMLDSCGADFDRYELYYQPTEQHPLELVASLSTEQGTITYQDPFGQSIAGCYYLYAYDTVGNRTDPFVYCVENCPVLILPNVFTPNGDGINDVVTPIEVRSVERIEMSIFDRWGNLIATSTDIERLWDGKDQNGHLAVPGVYFYQVKIYPYAYRKEVIYRTGYITLIR